MLILLSEVGAGFVKATRMVFSWIFSSKYIWSNQTLVHASGCLGTRTAEPVNIGAPVSDLYRRLRVSRGSIMENTIQAPQNTSSGGSNVHPEIGLLVERCLGGE